METDTSTDLRSFLSRLKNFEIEEAWPLLERFDLRGRLELHRMRPVETQQGYTLEKLDEDPEEHNLGVIYRFGISLFDKNHGMLHGWATGAGYLDYDSGAVGVLYAPNGFEEGELAFVYMDDWLLSSAKRLSAKELQGTPMERFLDSLRKSDIEQMIEYIQGFSLVGEIKNIRKPRKFFCHPYLRPPYPMAMELV
jgi:hypothetical protein